VADPGRAFEVEKYAQKSSENFSSSKNSTKEQLFQKQQKKWE
jgi:hypothetical protein